MNVKDGTHLLSNCYVTKAESSGNKGRVKDRREIIMRFEV